MAFKKTVVQRLFNLSRFSTPSLGRHSAAKPTPNPTRTGMDPEPGDRGNGMNQKRPISAGAASSPGTAAMRMFPLSGDKLAETLREMDRDMNMQRLNLDGMVAYPKKAAEVEEEEVGLTVGEVRKVLRATQVEMVREKLSGLGKEWVTYKEFEAIMVEFCGGNREQAMSLGKTLDESGCVIVMGNSVCLRPLQVAKAIHGLVTATVSTDLNDPRRKELEVLEEQKAVIDKKAEELVRRELWAGLGYMAVQTAAFMRLTFWELSWDVMEPVCFYVTSAYFMLGYTFFLRTSKEPSFEGFFQSRFHAKQKKLIQAQNFNLHKYNELRKAFYPHSSSGSSDPARLFKFHHQKSC